MISIICILLEIVISSSALSQIHIKAVGDIMPGSLTPKRIIPPDSGRIFVKNVSDFLKGTDICFANLEGAVIEADYKPVKCSDSSRQKGVCYEFGIPSYLIPSLKESGFNVFNLDNNHSFDYGRKGFENTMEVLKELKLSFAPPKGHSYFKVKNKSIAIVAFSYEDESYNINNIEESQLIIRQYKSTNDIVIVSFHGGGEGSAFQHVEDKNEIFLEEKRGNVLRFSRAVIDAGASLVIGHGPHVLRAMEIYKNKLIAYSLGNFLTYGNFNISGVSGKSVVLDLMIDESTGDFISGRLIPFKQTVPGIPEFDNKLSAVALIKKLSMDDIEENNLVIDSEGNLKKNRK